MALNLLSGLDAKVANRRIEEVESSDVMPLVKVGSFLPNAWGLYDMHGNVWEWCLDRMNGGGWCDWTADAKETDTDPKGLATGSSRIRRGGSWYGGAHDCREIAAAFA